MFRLLSERPGSLIIQREYGVTQWSMFPSPTTTSQSFARSPIEMVTLERGWKNCHFETNILPIFWNVIPVRDSFNPIQSPSKGTISVCLYTLYFLLIGGVVYDIQYQPQGMGQYVDKTTASTVFWCEFQQGIKISLVDQVLLYHFSIHDPIWFLRVLKIIS